MKSSLKIFVLSAILLAGCGTSSPEEEVAKTPPKAPAPAAKKEVRETPNVTYSGTVAPAGISIYQEGSHRLVLSDDRFILLESDSVDLNGYVDEEVKVTGSVRPTVEEGGMIMRVDNITLKKQKIADVEGETLEEESLEESESSEAPEEEQTSSEAPEEPSNEDEEEAEEESSEEENGNEEESEDPVSEEEVLSAELLEIIESMAKDDYSPERWTQPQYCTGHIGFCVPIHKNWWYKSFGNTTSHLWHLELSNKKIESLGDGPIVVKLVAGSIGSKKATDKQVRVQANTVIGFRAWDDNSHFEIVADKSLENPVKYLTRELSKFEE